MGGVAGSLGVVYLSDLGERSIALWAMALILLAAGASLVIGFMTPFASVVTGLSILGIAFSWFPVPPLPLLGARMMTLAVVITAAGIALLGPGAFSIDGYLFGRREIIIPPRMPEV